MAPEEATVLWKIGQDVVTNFIAIVNETVWFTVYSILVVKASFILLSKDRRRSPSCILNLVAIILMYAIAMVLWALDLTNFLKEVKITLVEDPDVAIQTKYNDALAFIFRLMDAEDALYAYSSLLGDAIILWREYNLMPYHRRWIVIIPCAVLIGSCIATLMLTFCAARLGSDIVFGAFQKPAFCRNVQIVSYSMAFATTAIATICIGMRTWHYRKAISPYLNTSLSSPGSESGESGTRRRRQQSPSERLLFLLLESGILYSLFFAVQLFAYVPEVHAWILRHSALSFSFVMYSYCTSIIVGMYPTAIIVFAHSDYAVRGVGVTNDYRFQGTSMRFQNTTSVNSGPKSSGSGGASMLWPARHHPGFDDDVELISMNVLEKSAKDDSKEADLEDMKLAS